MIRNVLHIGVLRSTLNWTGLNSPRLRGCYKYVYNRRPCLGSSLRTRRSQASQSDFVHSDIDMFPVCGHSQTAASVPHCLLSYLGQQYVMRFDRSKRLSASKKTEGGKRRRKKNKTGHILTPDNRCCHSEPIIVSIMKSVGQKRGALSFPYSGPSFLCIPLFIRSRLLITVLFASESRMPYNLLPQKHPSMQMKWPKKEEVLYLLLWPTVLGWV